MSLFSSLLGGGNSAGNYVKQQNSLIKQTAGLAGQAQIDHDTAARNGAWDPNAQLAQLKDDTAYQTKINTGNSAAAARTLGYRPGDTVPIQNMQATNNASQLQYANQANQIRYGALQAGYQAAQNLTNQKAGFYGQAMGANAGMIDYAQRQDAQQGAMFSNLLGTAMPFLGGVNLGQVFSKPAGKSPVTSPPPNGGIGGSPLLYGTDADPNSFRNGMAALNPSTEIEKLVLKDPTNAWQYRTYP